MSVEKRNGRWRARVRLPDRTERSRTFDRRADAVAWEADQYADLRDDTWVDPHGRDRLYRDVAADWWAGHAPTLAERSRGTAEADLGRSVAVWGHRRIGSIGRSDGQGFVNGLGLSVSSVRRAHWAACQVMDHAVAEGLVKSHRLRDVTLPVDRRTTADRITVIDPPVLWRLADAVDERFRVFVLVGGLTGMRFGEVAGLHWEQVDRVGPSILVDRTAVEVDGTVVGVKAPKSNRARRVAIPTVLADELAAHGERFFDGDGRVFSGWRGGWVTRSMFHRYWKAARLEVGEPDLRFHDLRHSHVAALIAGGAHAKAIQQRLGHASIQTTFDVYGHLLPSADDDLAAILDGQAETARRLRVV